MEGKIMGLDNNSNGTVAREITPWVGLVLAIDSSCSRKDKCEDGFYSVALFSVDGIDYIYKRYKGLFRVTSKGVVDVKCGECKNGQYQQYRFNYLGKAQYCFQHVLELLCLTDSFTHTYMSDNSICVNHKTIWGDYCQGKTDVADLELISRGDNTRHANFVRRYNLIGISISSGNIPALQALFNHVYGQLLNFSKTELVVNLNYRLLCQADNILNTYCDNYDESNLSIEEDGIKLLDELGETIVKYYYRKLDDAVALAGVHTDFGTSTDKECIAVYRSVPDCLLSSTENGDLSGLTILERINRAIFNYAV